MPSNCYKKNNLGQVFYHIAKKHSEKIALKYTDDKKTTYDELNQLSNQLAYYLKNCNIKKGDTIAIFHDKSPLAYSLMLAAIKIGVIYSNLDFNNPVNRLEKMLNTLQPKQLFVFNDLSRSIKVLIDKKNIKATNIHKNIEQINQLSKENLKETDNLNSQIPLYIVFTSGSTGTPKGVTISHKNILSFLSWTDKAFEFSKNEIFTGLNPAYFDNSVFDFYISLFNGFCLCPIDSEILKTPDQLIKKIQNLNCTTWFSVPSLLVYLLTTRSLDKSSLLSIKRFIFGGEGFPKNFLKQLFDLYAESSQLINVYGPSECSCICSFHEITKNDFNNMDSLAPLGKITENFNYKIINQTSNNTQQGELYLTGSGVGLGYFNAIEQTNLAFVKSVNLDKNNIYYKTGDIVQEKNNLLYFLGRSDNQIKHMGYRIELEEIENHLNNCDLIKQSAVVYYRKYEFAGKLYAFIVSNNTFDKEQEIIIKIENAIKEKLPQYMQPNIIKLVKELPKNRSGKINRQLLLEEIKS